jgi:tRNA uridine 5-carbamoylmethylation protein Kti12
MIIIFRGIQGSGKTTASNLLAGKSLRTSDDELSSEIQKLRAKIESFDIVRCSSDDHFTSVLDGVYNFVPSELSVAHGKCMRKAIESVQKGWYDKASHATIIDNTNCSIAEVGPYCQLANAYDQELHVLTLLAEPLAAWRRNSHGVPMTNVVKSDLALRQSILEWPPWWPQKLVLV